MARQQTILDPFQWVVAQASNVDPRFAFTAKDAREARAWQRRARKALFDLVGFLDQRRVSLQPRTVESVDRGSYVRRKVIIRTTEHSHMPMYVLTPKNARPPLPCVLALHGHGYGVKDIVGLWEDGGERTLPSGYHKDFACGLAERGFMVAAPEISCFGQRRRSIDLAEGPGKASCHLIANYALMLGGSAVGMRVWDGMRAVDYLETLHEADTARLGAMGISGGGMHTFFSTALDSRIKACVISGYFCNWQQSTLAVHHCPCNYVPGLLQLGELSDLAGLIAPRPCLVEAANRDPIFPIDGVKRTVRRARRSWAAFEARDLLQTDYFEGRHEISGAKAYDFFAQCLQS